MRRGLGWGLLSRLSLSLLYGHEILRMDMGAVYGRYWIGYRCVLWEYTSRLLFFFFLFFSAYPCPGTLCMDIKTWI